MATYKYPNVILEYEDIRYPNHINPDGTLLDVIIDTPMAALIDVLAVKYPLWEFRVYDVRKISLDRLSATYFKVFNGNNPRELIGTLQLGRRYSNNGSVSEVYIVGGKRIAANRERGTTVETKHAKAAIKAVNKYFTPAPWDERLDKLYREAISTINFAESEASVQLRRVDTNMHEIINKFLTDNWAMFLDGLSDSDTEIAEQRVERFKTHSELSKLHDEARNKRNILTVIIEGDKYVVQTTQGISTYSSEQLPEEVRMKIGMLKLTDAREVVANIGVKIDTGYLITLDQPLQQGA